MLNKYLDKLERKLGKFAVPNLMLFIVLGMAVVYFSEMLFSTNPNTNISLTSLLTFNLPMIMKGQIWRVITFIIIPPSSGFIIFTIFALYFYWFMGTGLESHWGSFKFNVYYITGFIGCIIVGFLTGYADNAYLNLSLFLAFAILFPNEQLLLFFIIPIKVKWLGIIDGIFLIVMFILGDFSTKLLLIVSFANLLLFFGKDFFSGIYYFFRRYYYKWFKNK